MGKPNLVEKRLLALVTRLEDAERERDVRRQVSLQKRIAQIYEDIDDDAESIGWLLRLMELCRRENLVHEAYVTAMSLGRLHLENQLYDKAIRHYLDGENYCKPNSKRSSRARVRRASALNWQHRCDEAEELLTPILKRGNLTHEDRLFAKRTMAAIRNGQKRRDDALALYRECVAEMDGLQESWQADILKSLAFTYYNMGDYENAIETLKEVERRFTDTSNHHLWKMVYNALYASYENKGDLITAYEYIQKFYKAEKAISEDKVNNKLMAIQVNNRMIQVQHEREMLERQAKELAEKNRVIEEERRKSDNLLLNILPEGVANELKQRGEVSARLHPEVTVLFSDFSGFTGISELLSPQELVAEIDTCFRAFDSIMGRYGVEKIKTIGDAYMAVSGLPEAHPEHAKNAVRAALEMRDFMVQRAVAMPEGIPAFKIRIGLHSGPVIAGVVGTRKFAYDVWGDTVNTAARMESSGQVGKVNISAATHRLIANDFTFEARGKVTAKGKGEMEMYFVEPLDH